MNAMTTCASDAAPERDRNLPPFISTMRPMLPSMKADPRDEVALLQPLAEGRNAGGREVHRLGQGEQDCLENLSASRSL